MRYQKVATKSRANSIEPPYKTVDDGRHGLVRPL